VVHIANGLARYVTITDLVKECIGCVCRVLDFCSGTPPLRGSLLKDTLVIVSEASRLTSTVVIEYLGCPRHRSSDYLGYEAMREELRE
jgi:hypothetical protein